MYIRKEKRYHFNFNFRSTNIVFHYYHYQIMSFTLVYRQHRPVFVSDGCVYGTPEHHDEEARL